MPTRRVRARLVTTHAVEAYGGVRLDESVVEEVAAAVGRGAMPMHLDHDRSRPINASNVASGTERLPDGHVAAWVEFDVDANDWDAIDDAWRQAGAPGGMSISLTAPLVGGGRSANAPIVVVAADAHHFTDAEILQAVSELKRLDESAAGERLYQFSAEPAAAILFDIVIPAAMSLGPNLTAAVIYDAAKYFFLRPRTHGSVTVDITFRQEVYGDRLTTVHLEATTSEQLRVALAGLPGVLESGTKGTFTSENGNQLRPTMPTPREDDPGPSRD